jgi:hypothetical protein
MIPPYKGHVPGEVVFISGTLRTGVSGGHILVTLNEKCNVSPFLLIEDGRTALTGTIGQLEATSTGRRRVHSTSRPVLDTLVPLMENVQLTIEPVDSLRKVVDHRYDRLV